MSNNSRIGQLEQYLLEDPKDPFLKYALALEYLENDPEKCQNYFEDLLENHKDYVGTYYHAAHFFASIGKPEKADSVFIKGMEVAKRLNENHALKELKSAYLNFQLDEG